MTVLLAAALVGVTIATSVVLVLRRSFVGWLSESSEDTDPGWRQYRPIQRLLDPADFDYLRRKGIDEPKIKKLRAQRRRLYRMCLRSLASDFHRVQRELSLVVVHSRGDRPDLVTEMAKQRIAFYRSLVLAEIMVALDACGLAGVPTVDLLGPIEALQSRLQQFATLPSAA